jgi:hypothetical protein
MRATVLILIALFCWSPLGSQAAEGMRIVKILKHLLDAEGRHTISPSLLDRDAYQAQLRDQPESVSGLRFDVQLKLPSKSASPLLLKVKIRHGSGSTIDTYSTVSTLKQTGRRRPRWGQIVVSGDDYLKLGTIIAWRVSLWDGDTEVSKQESFLW